MVLNSVAIYFIVELDDEAVFASDFQQIKQWLDIHYDDFIDDYYEKHIQNENTKDCHSKCDNVYVWIIKFMNIIGNRKYNQWFLLPWSVIAPVYILICY